MSQEEEKTQPAAGQDIRKFFQQKAPARKPAAGSAPPKPRTSAAAAPSAAGGSSENAPVGKQGANDAAHPSRSKYVESSDDDFGDDDDKLSKPDTKAKATGEAAEKAPASSTKRKARSNVIVLDSDDDDDYQAGASSSDDSDDDDDDDFVVDDDDEYAPAAKKRAGSAAKKARTSSAPKAAATRKSPAARPRASSAKKATKREVPKMVIEPHKKATASASPSQASAKKARKPAELPDLPKQAKKQKVEKSAPPPDVQRAIDLVDEAAEKLASPAKDSIKFMDTCPGAWRRRKQAPRNPGSKDIPLSHSQCFTGKTFVFSGTLDSLSREEAKALVEGASGRVTGDVSSKSSFLVVGFDCGRSKYDKATAMGIKVIDEDGMLALMAASAPAAPQQQPGIKLMQQAVAGSSRAIAAQAASPRGGAGASTSGGPQETVQAKLPDPAKQAKKRKVEKSAHPPDVQRAIDLVDEAAEKLASPAKGSIKFMWRGAWNQREQAPLHPGSKDIPSGHPKCFTGKTFVFSGILDSLSREKATSLVERAHGRVTKQVSGKSSFLVVGFDCGRSKYDKAIAMGVKVIDEDGMLALMAASAPAAPQQQQQQDVAGRLAPVSEGAFHAGSEPVPGAEGTGQAVAGSSRAASAQAGPSRGGAEASTSGGPHETQPWVDKHKRTDASELTGGHGIEWKAGWKAMLL